MRFQAVKERLREMRPDIAAALGAAFLFAFFLMPGDYLPDHDAYFHVRIAEQMGSHGVVTSLSSMSETIHAKRYVDFHFLFHALQVPFVWAAPDLIQAAKWSTVVFASFSVFSLSLLLRRLGAPHAWFWILFFTLASPVFTGRLLFGRGITLFAGVIFLFLLFLEKKRSRAAFAVSLAAVWMYPGFPVLGLIGALYMAAVFARQRRVDKTALAGLAGLAAGFVVHPSFPSQFYGYWLEFVVHSSGAPGLEQIGEWQAPGSQVAAAALFLPLVVLTTALVALKLRAGPVSAVTLGCAVIFIGVTSVAMKPFEYVVPFLTVFLAVQPWGDWNTTLRRALAGALLAVLFFFHLPDVYKRMETQMQLAHPGAAFEAADWVKNHAPAGEHVLLHWGDFPLFFFRAPEYVYQAGLNPVYFYGENRDRYFLNRSFFEATAVNFYVVPGFFGARYAVLNLRYHARAAELLAGMPERAKLVFRNTGYVVFDFSAAPKP